MFAIFVLVLVSFADITLQAEWSYGRENEWPGICTTGQQQSPINIMTRDAVVDEHQAHIRGPLRFQGYHNVEMYAENNGHTVQWNVVKGKPAPVLSGGPLRGEYTLMQFHFHWLSEHALDGMKYPLEIHFVHIKKGLTVDEAFKRSDGLAVIGVFAVVHRGFDSSRALEQIMPMLPYIIDSRQNGTQAERIDVTRLLSPEPQAYYSYHGSLTTPLCQEIVTWMVMEKPIFITADQYKTFIKVDIGDTDYNYRSLQPINNRVVYRSIASCASIVTPGPLIGLLTCLASTVNRGVTTFKRKLFGNGASNSGTYFQLIAGN